MLFDQWPTPMAAAIFVHRLLPGYVRTTEVVIQSVVVSEICMFLACCGSGWPAPLGPEPGDQCLIYTSRTAYRGHDTYGH